uniref:Homologous-pairing protein 2 homolog n=2 Tax=Palpitomonas bilix TaxID=652834 RepID=A0A7S3GM86_9EUKA|mmetsp:Transcript_9310/g.25330  ORF Transcript_9310/g.25330 Transcript_9310/m.25330 type:complete len:225 (+) Transcript_9310:206-880(+)|eukprot:CAMPEP_0113887454 /NCGR_PEP_ID=MMETSP0780_2-20120614/12222_1 /TAXON_ID=652834 /ORGANISM="Palpitomonas bilix" /LENGTH=224 /DNA_ID=CAMNT_0000875987 /DNA_START=158 /DNA_END=832 /DNA_ORIENTATION=+ /assembly_acc=CAM_ASM_000599
MGKRAADEQQGETDILNFLNEQNRPFNCQNIVDALSPKNKAMKKTLVQKCLDGLSSRDEITCKEFGKVKIYLANQANFEIPTDEELREMDASIESLEAERKKISALLSSLHAERKTLSEALTDSELKKRIEGLNEEVNRMSKRVSTIEGGTELASKEEIQQASKNFDKYAKVWVDRKRKCMDAVEQIGEGMEKKTLVVMEEFGLETDEECGVKLNKKSKKVEKL